MHIHWIALPSEHASGVKCVGDVEAMHGPPAPVDVPDDDIPEVALEALPFEPTTVTLD